MLHKTSERRANSFSPTGAHSRLARRMGRSGRRFDMKRLLITSIVVLLFGYNIGAVAQTRPAGPVPRTADGRPDLSGAWWPGRDVPLRPLGEAAPTATAAAPQRPTIAGLYQPSAVEKAKTLGDKDDPALRCIPTAFGTLNVSLLGEGFVGQIIQDSKFVVMLTETYHKFQIVPTDGRKHRDDV